MRALLQEAAATRFNDHFEFLVGEAREDLCGLFEFAGKKWRRALNFTVAHACSKFTTPVEMGLPLSPWFLALVRYRTQTSRAVAARVLAY